MNNQTNMNNQPPKNQNTEPNIQSTTETNNNTNNNIDNTTSPNNNTTNKPTAENNIPPILTSTNTQTSVTNTNTVTTPLTDTNTTINSTPTVETNNVANTPSNNTTTNTPNIQSNEINNNINNTTKDTTPKKHTSPIVIIAIILVIGVGAYFAYNKFFNNNTTISPTNNGNTTSNTNTNSNNDIYPNQEVYEIPMGTAKNGVFKKLCTVKIGGKLYTAGSIFNTAGEEDKVESIGAPLLEDAYKEIDFNNYFANFLASNGGGISMSFFVDTIKQYDTNTWEELKIYDEKNNIKTIEIGSEEHPAYFRRIESNGDTKNNLLYKFDNDWMLSINYDGELIKLSDKELGEKLYNLITPI